MKHRKFIIPIFIPDLGCPNKCVFCNQKKITGQQWVPERDQVKQTIDKYLKTLPDDSANNVEIAFYGGSFTAIPTENQRSYLSIAWGYVRQGRVSGIRISTRPDRIYEETLELLSAYGVTTIELGVQSFDREVLELSQRGHSVDDVYKASELIRSWGFFLGIQLMLGLPGDSQAKALETCERVIGLAPNFVRIYPVFVLKETELENMFVKGDYTPWTLNEVVDTAKVMVNRFERAGIEVIRIGLQNTEEISPEGEVVAGPYHPAIGELVYAAIAGEQLKEILKRAGVTPGSARTLEVVISPRDESKVRGHKSTNMTRIIAEFGLDDLIVTPVNELPPGYMKLIAVDGKPVDVVLRLKELTL